MYYPIFYPIFIDRSAEKVPTPEIVVYILLGGIAACLIGIAVIMWIELRR